MGWFSSIFKGKEKEPVRQASVVSLSELASKIEENITAKMTEFSPDLKRFYSNMQSATDRLQEKLNILAKAVPMEQVDFQLLKIAISNRDETVRKLNAVLKEFKRPINVNLDNFVEFHNSCISSLIIVNTKLTRNFSIFEQVFRQESVSVMSGYKNLYRVLEDIGVNLKGKKSIADPLNELKNQIKQLENDLNAVNNNCNLIGNLNSEISSLKNKETETKSQLDNLFSKEEWNTFRRLVEDKEALNRETKTIEGKIIQTLLSVERALKKYSNISSANEKRVIEFYLKDPLTASISDKSQVMIKAIMNSIEGAIADKKIDVGEKKEKRILENVEEIKNGSIDNFVKTHDTLESKMQEIKIKLEKSDVESVKQSLEFELAKTKSGVVELETKVKKLENFNETKNKEIDNTRILLENLVQAALNQKIKIELPNIGVLIIQKPN